MVVDIEFWNVKNFRNNRGFSIVHNGLVMTGITHLNVRRKGDKHVKGNRFFSVATAQCNP